MRHVAVALALTVLVWAPARGQQGTSELGGKVEDAQGGRLPGVAIVITNEETGTVRELVTGADGTYFAQQLTPGRYRISAELTGFRRLERRDVSLVVGRTQTVDLKLEVGGLTEAITVSGEPPLLDSRSAEVGGHITGQEMTELPTATRSYMALVGNVPGVQFVPSSEFLNDTMMANGQSANANNVVFDGAGNMDDRAGSNVGGQVRTAVEAVQEVQVLTNQYDAEWGRAAGAIVNAVTKSGTNTFAGSAFGYFTDGSLTAKDFFVRTNDLDKPDSRKQQWGGTLGGPIVRNRMHFFTSLERVKFAEGQSRVFPTAPQFDYSVASDASAWNMLVRIDHQLTKNHTWAFRILREKAPQYLNLDGANDTLQSYDDETDLDETIVGTLTSVLGDSRVNTVRASLTREDQTNANPLWRADSRGDQALLPPMLAYNSFNLQADDTQNRQKNLSYAIEDTLSWFIRDRAGTHDTKVGARYTYAEIDTVNNGNANGTYTFGHNTLFDPSDPRAYPERFSIRVGGPLHYTAKSHVYELFAQDKWQMGSNLTVGVGVRYDLEVFPLEETFNPFFSNPADYPVDKNNVSPRLSVTWTPGSDGRSVVRGGYGVFYNRTLLGTVDNIITDNKFLSSFNAVFPARQADPGPSNGSFPTDPTLVTPTVGDVSPDVRAYVSSQYPEGQLYRNSGNILWDSPDREMPYFHQMTAGYERLLFGRVSLSADYVRMLGRSLFLQPNLNIGRRLDTSRTGPIEFDNPFGVLDEPYTAAVRLLTNDGSSTYDALNLSIERRLANGWSLRGAYTLSSSRGVALNPNDTPQLQVGTDLNLDDYNAPSNVDRRHNLVVSGRLEVPGLPLTVSGMARMLSGVPFSITDSSIDADQNGVLFDPLPAGTYSGTADNSLQDVENDGGRNGARGPGFVQVDMRAGYRFRWAGRRTLDIVVDVFNITNRANFTNPSGDRRIGSDFLRLSGLAGISGFPRQVQFGARLGF